MLIAVAGPYSAPSADQRKRNLDAMNHAAAEVFRRGHIPVIGVNAALPVMEMLETGDPYEAMMKISLAVVGVCDAILMIGQSPGANREKDLLISKGRTVFWKLDDIPIADENVS